MFVFGAKEGSGLLLLCCHHTLSNKPKRRLIPDGVYSQKLISEKNVSRATFFHYFEKELRYYSSVIAAWR